MGVPLALTFYTYLPESHFEDSSIRQGGRAGRWGVFFRGRRLWKVEKNVSFSHIHDETCTLKLRKFMGHKSTTYDKEPIEMAYISQEARALYLERRKQEGKQCREAVLRANWELIGRVGHKMKGNAETFGFNSLTDIGSDLEYAALDKDGDRVLKLLDQLCTELESLSADKEY